mgnify:CR=1 FL=1
MNIDRYQYRKYAAAHAPKSPVLRNSLRAFWVGGSICVLAQGLSTIFTSLCHMERDYAATLTSVTLIFLAVFLTAIGVFDKIARYAGAGTLVPITGFANAMVSPALEFKREGLILGVGAKMFSIAGPVILYGSVASVIYGLILAIFG